MATTGSLPVWGAAVAPRCNPAALDGHGVEPGGVVGARGPRCKGAAPSAPNGTCWAQCS